MDVKRRNKAEKREKKEDTKEKPPKKEKSKGNQKTNKEEEGVEADQIEEGDVAVLDTPDDNPGNQQDLNIDTPEGEQEDTGVIGPGVLAQGTLNNNLGNEPSKTTDTAEEEEVEKINEEATVVQDTPSNNLGNELNNTAETAEVEGGFFPSIAGPGLVTSHVGNDTTDMNAEGKSDLGVGEQGAGEVGEEAMGGGDTADQGLEVGAKENGLEVGDKVENGTGWGEEEGEFEDDEMLCCCCEESGDVGDEGGILSCLTSCFITE